MLTTYWQGYSVEKMDYRWQHCKIYALSLDELLGKLKDNSGDKNRKIKKFEVFGT